MKTCTKCGRRLLVHQRQGKGECFVTSIAILAGVDRTQVIRWGRQYTLDCADRLGYRARFVKPGTRWYRLMGVYRDWELINAVQEHFLPGTDAINLPLRHDLFEESTIALDKPTCRRALLILACKPRGRHAVVYDGGVIFDPSTDREMTWEEWSSRLRKGTCIEQVIPIEED